jgi:hypothetical protein
MEFTNPHNLSTSAELKHVLKTEIVTIYFYEDIVVVEAEEGVTLSYKTGFSILVSGLKYIGNRPFIYITNRVNSYSVNPHDYVYLEKIPTLKGLAIVAPHEIRKQNAQLEIKFFKKPIAICESVSEAYAWGKEILNSSHS